MVAALTDALPHRRKHPRRRAGARGQTEPGRRRREQDAGGAASSCAPWALGCRLWRRSCSGERRAPLSGDERKACAFDSSVVRRAACPPLELVSGEKTMIGPEFPVVLEAATRGDEEAFGSLWRDLQPRLLRYFMVAVPAAAEDLASETWLAVVRGLDRFRGNEPAFRAWVFTIGRHEVLDWRRRAARRPTEDLPANALAELAAPDDPAIDAVEGFSTRAALAMVAGLDVNLVATIMGKRPGTVRVLTHRGLRRLAERLGADARIRGMV